MLSDVDSKLRFVTKLAIKVNRVRSNKTLIYFMRCKVAEQAQVGHTEILFVFLESHKLSSTWVKRERRVGIEVNIKRSRVKRAEQTNFIQINIPNDGKVFHLKCAEREEVFLSFNLLLVRLSQAFFFFDSQSNGEENRLFHFFLSTLAHFAIRQRRLLSINISALSLTTKFTFEIFDS